MKKIVIFGTGAILKACLDRIPLDLVSVFADNDKEKWGSLFHGKQVISPEELKHADVHRVYIATADHFSTIFEQLVTKCGIEKKKIKGIHCLLPLMEDAFDGGRKIGNWRVVEDIAAALASMGAVSVHDDGNHLRDYAVLSPYDDRLKKWRNMGRWTIVKNVEAYRPDTVLFVDSFTRMSMDSVIEKIQRARTRWGAACLLTACGRWDDESEAWIRELQSHFPDIIVRQYFSCVVVVIPRAQRVTGRIFIVTHKPYMHPLWADRASGYETVLAGSQGKRMDDGLRDDKGDNISCLNGKINECTAIYWVWKHQPQKVVGFCHYRRYFLDVQGNECSHQQILTVDAAERYLKESDILVSSPYCIRADTVIGTVQHTTEKAAFDYGWKLVRQMFEKYHPEDMNILKDVMHGEEMYPCNMFITRWEVFDAYCTWLFSFLIPAAEEADVSCFDDYSKRIIGFFAERMLTVWLVKHPELRIKTLPILQTDA